MRATPESTTLRRLQLRFPEPELERQFLLSYRAAARRWIRMRLGLSFSAALRTNLLLIGAYATAALLGAIATPVAIYSLFVLLCANLIGGAGWSFHERSSADTGELPQGDGEALQSAG